MADWGWSGDTAGTGATSTWRYFMLGPAVTGTLDSISVWGSANLVVTQSCRVGVYKSSSNTDPTAAVLLEDLGEITSPTASTFNTINSTTHPTLNQESYLILCVDYEDWDYAGLTAVTAGDITACWRAFESGALPTNPSAGMGSTSVPTVYLTYTATGGGTTVPIMMNHYRRMRG